MPSLGAFLFCFCFCYLSDVHILQESLPLAASLSSPALFVVLPLISSIHMAFLVRFVVFPRPLHQAWPLPFRQAPFFNGLKRITSFCYYFDLSTLGLSYIFILCFVNRHICIWVLALLSTRWVIWVGCLLPLMLYFPHF